jgi:opine dehydrogenase
VGGRGLKVAILGGGHGALATAADLGSRGFEVRLALRNRPRFEALFKSRHVRMTGVLEAEAELAEVTTDHAAAVRGADLVLVPLPAYAQDAMAEAIADAVEPGQVICLMPGTFGAYQVGRRLGGVAVAEMATLPYGARQRSENEVGTALHAHHLPTGVYPASETERALAVIRSVYSQAEPVEDALSAALLNSNGALHAPLMVLNAGPISRGPYDIHVEGTTPLVCRVVEATDRERVALRQALGYRTAHWPLADYYADRDWFYGPGAYSSVQRRSVWRERLDFQHRYVVEDVAIGLALWSSLGRALRVRTPLTDALIDLVAAITGADYRSSGRTLERLGLAGLDADGLRDALR